MKYKAIIYDVDGTLLNTTDMNMIPLQQIIKEEKGITIPYDDVLQYASMAGSQVMEALEIEDKENTYARWVRYVNEYKEGAMIYDGVEDMLEYFDQKIIQCVVTSKTRAQYQIDMVQKGLDKYMTCSVVKEDTNNHKPLPDPLLLCLEKCDLKKEEVIYIGDAYSDFVCCKNAGIDFGFATWGALQPIEEEVTYRFDTPLELITKLSY